jgi:hypothetical protein
MRNGCGIVFLSLMLLQANATARADTISKLVPADRSSEIDHYTGWNDDCSFKEISVNVVANPAHGVVISRIADGKIASHASIGSSGSCAGKPTKVLELFYRPARGYHGEDRFSVNLSVGNSSPVVYDYDVTVQ